MWDTVTTVRKLAYKPFVASLKRSCPSSMAPPLGNDILKWAWPSQPPDQRVIHLEQMQKATFVLYCEW